MSIGIAQVGSATPSSGRVGVYASLADAPCGEGELEALAWIDLRNGSVLAASVKDERAREAVELAAHGARQLCSAPCLDSPEADDVHAGAALVVSERAIHAFVRSRPHPDRAVVGIACGGANVALLLAWIRILADATSDASGEELQ